MNKTIISTESPGSHWSLFPGKSYDLVFTSGQIA